MYVITPVARRQLRDLHETRKPSNLIRQVSDGDDIQRHRVCVATVGYCLYYVESISLFN